MVDFPELGRPVNQIVTPLARAYRFETDEDVAIGFFPSVLSYLIKLGYREFGE